MTPLKIRYNHKVFVVCESVSSVVIRIKITLSALFRDKFVCLFFKKRKKIDYIFSKSSITNSVNNGRCNIY